VTYLDDPDPDAGLHEDLDQAGAEAPSDAEGLLHEVIALVANAKAMPLSSSVLVSRDEVLGLLDEAVASLPDELKRARWTLADLDALTEQRRREADALLDEVRAEAARLVSRTEISRQAKVHAERLVADAEERGRAILHEAEDFCDQRLAQMEIVLDRLQKTVQSGRARLRPRIEPDVAEADGDAGDEGAFFDQDTV
jgi:cell division septum initiation protein DivIVA